MCPPRVVNCPQRKAAELKAKAVKAQRVEKANNAKPKEIIHNGVKYILNGDKQATTG